MNNFVLHRAADRGHANHGWLTSFHSFSFASFYDPTRMGFGVLRVLNDDHVAAGGGFGLHPHSNMEIISIPLAGDLRHKDSMGNEAIIRHGDIQVMSAGTGIKHAEYNHSTNSPVKFLQIWVEPNKQNVTPRYEQKTLDLAKRQNQFHQILAPEPTPNGVWIHQDAWFHLGNFDADLQINYVLNKPTTNGVYVFLLSGEIEMNGEILQARDAMGCWDITDLSFRTLLPQTEVLLMEVPMAQTP